MAFQAAILPELLLLSNDCEALDAGARTGPAGVKTHGAITAQEVERKGSSSKSGLYMYSLLPPWRPLFLCPLCHSRLCKAILLLRKPCNVNVSFMLGDLEAQGSRHKLLDCPWTSQTGHPCSKLSTPLRLSVQPSPSKRLFWLATVNLWLPVRAHAAVCCTCSLGRTACVSVAEFKACKLAHVHAGTNRPFNSQMLLLRL